MKKTWTALLAGGISLLVLIGGFAQEQKSERVSITELARQVEPLRKQNRISLATFKKMANEPNTVILDSRSKERYDLHHIEGAIHLDFSEFSEQKVRELVPDPDTRILIYCDNNFGPPGRLYTHRSQYDAVRVRKLVEPSKERSVVVPAEYRTLTEQRLVAPATTKTVVVPVEYKTISQRVMVSPPTTAAARTKTIDVPSEYKTITKRVMITPPSVRQRLVVPAATRKIEVPKEYKTVSKRVMVPPPSATPSATPSVRSKRVPARYADIAVRQKVEPATYSTAVALNIPTFIFLNNYGYQHVYELGPLLAANDRRLRFAGSSVTTDLQGTFPKPLAKTAKEHVDYPGFIGFAERFEPLRAERILSHKAFSQRAEMPNTVVLDTRSKSAYDQGHFPGAVHLNFTEFNQQKLNKAIPSGTTQVLFYGNKPPASSASTSPGIDLNIPTFITLMAYGYKDVYELTATDVSLATTP